MATQIFNYLSGTSGSGATITFPSGPPSSSGPTAYNDVGQGQSNYKSIGFSYTASIPFDFTFTITSSTINDNIYFFYTVAPLPAADGNEFNVYVPYITTSSLTDITGNIVPWTASSSSIQGVTFNLINNPANYYISILFSIGDSTGNGSGTILTNSTACFASNTLVLMGDYSLKQIKDIERYDIVMSDVETGDKSIVSRNIKTFVQTAQAYMIPKGLLGNLNDIIGLGVHPIWCNGGKERVLLKNIDGVIKTDYTDLFHTLQFDHEGTFYVEGIKVDSLSPYHKKLPLGQENFINPELFVPGIIIKTENDNSRTKPHLGTRKVKPKEIDYISLVQEIRK